MLLERMKRSTGIPTGLATWLMIWDGCDGWMFGIWVGYLALLPAIEENFNRTQEPQNTKMKGFPSSIGI